MDRAKLKSGLRERWRHLDEADFLDTKSRLADVPNPRLGPKVVHRHQVDDIFRYGHGVLEKRPDEAPRWIGYDPINRLFPLEKISPFENFAPVGARHPFEEISLALARLKNPAARLEVLHNAAGKRNGGLDDIVAVVVAIRLIFHDIDKYEKGRPKVQLFFCKFSGRGKATWGLVLNVGCGCFIQIDSGSADVFERTGGGRNWVEQIDWHRDKFEGPSEAILSLAPLQNDIEAVLRRNHLFHMREGDAIQSYLNETAYDGIIHAGKFPIGQRGRKRAKIMCGGQRIGQRVAMAFTGLAGRAGSGRGQQ